MISFLARRTFQGLLVILLVITGTFLLEHFVPGGPAVVALGHRATPANIKIFNIQNGLNRPMFVQLLSYLNQAIHLNLGYSLIQHAPVWYLIKSALGHTVMLISVALVIQFVLAVPLGNMQAQRRNSNFDYVATCVTFILYATPVFLIGEFLISVFAIKFHFFPVTVNPSGGAYAIFTSPVQYVLPVLTLSLLGVGGLSRYQRSSMLDTLTQDYIRTAKAKGLPHRKVINRHAIRNSLLPMITIMGLSLPTIVGGALITETIFDIPGMGLLTLRSATNYDMPVVVGTTIVAAVVTVIGSLVADILYAIADPRIRLGSGGR
ncbi:MAG: ABC transporter permease [Acidimicrobiales bacterium]|jgi:peptide/nickel transport system permease protein